MAEVKEAALTEKARAAEARVGLLRLAVICIGSIAYPFLLDQTGTIPWLAYAVLGVAWAYALAVVAFKPYLRYPVLASALYTTVSDSILLMLWILATGGYDSPFWAIMFLSILAIAYRFSLRAAVTAWIVYAVLYAAVVTSLQQWPGHLGVVFVRLAYLGVGTAVAGLISTQSLEQGRAKLEIARVAETERRLRDEAGRSLSLLSATLESTADGLLVVDAGGKITSFNRRFAELWRLPQPILDSKSDDAALAFVLGQLKDPQGFIQKVQDLYSQPLAESFDTLEFQDGRVFERYSRPQLIDGKPVGRVWSFRDVTERVRAEREREVGRQHKEELEHLKALDSFKSQFINTAAHELNTPLTPILLQLHILRTSVAGTPQQEGFEILARNVKRMSELVGDLLDAAKYQAGRLVLEARPCDVAALVAECAETFVDIARERGVQLDVDAAPAMQATVDRRRVSQVFYNLLSNALKFTPAGGRVRLQAVATADHVEVHVEDNGVGIPQDELRRLFMPFTQLHGGNTGTGLGLYICKGIVEAHGGRIWVESGGAGKGTTFSFTLPLEPVALPQHGALTRPAGTPRGA